jgi:hypothetical protein
MMTKIQSLPRRLTAQSRPHTVELFVLITEKCALIRVEHGALISRRRLLSGSNFHPILERRAKSFTASTLYFRSPARQSVRNGLELF